MRHLLNHIVGANLCVRPTSGNIRYAVAQYSVQTAVLLLFMVIFVGCEESKRFEISGNDTTPPGAPVFVESKPLPGGASIFFTPPPDMDVLYIEASYRNVAGKTQRFAASFAADSLNVYGFGSEGDHEIELCAVDRAGNRSISVRQTVTALEPIVVSVAKSLNVLSSFSSMLMKWENEAEEPLYVWVDLAYTQNGVSREHTNVFNTNQTEIRSIDSLNLNSGEQLSVMATVRDKYDNAVLAKDTMIVLLTDNLIPKDKWTLVDAGTEIGGIEQVNGLRLDALIDGVIDIDAENYFSTLQANPWNIIIDLGEEYELSRIVTHQRWSGYGSATNEIPDLRGNLYRGGNVLTSIFHRWDATNQAWEQLSRRMIMVPSVYVDGEWTTLGKEGDKAFIFPEEPQFSKPTRFFRVEAINGNVLSEITLYGRKAQ